MGGSWHKFMKVGIVHFMAFPDCIRGEGPILETVEQIASDEFFSAIELGPIKDPGVRKQVRGILESSKLTPYFAAQPVILLGKLNLAALDEAERKRGVMAVKAALDDAAELGINRMAVLDGGGSYPGPGKAAEAEAALVRSLRELCAHARGLKVGVVLESFDRDIDKHSLIGPSADAARIAREIKAEFSDFGVMIDLSHLPLLGETSRHAISCVSDCLVHAHVGNCAFRDRGHRAYGDAHPRFGIDGGENDVPELADFLEALFEAGYLSGSEQELPAVSFEVKPLPGETSTSVIANAKRTLLEAWPRAFDRVLQRGLVSGSS
ncbi:MAG: TIM barrel protein [Firmicutes bacterium]|nr:TIM barrel protein [Bacillota bacterium]